jgi:hypothetical protein
LHNDDADNPDEDIDDETDDDISMLNRIDGCTCCKINNKMHPTQQSTAQYSILHVPHIANTNHST